ncbi:hypothetical protein F4805DRAFT_457040 [Annulohypoxylon moriforme]|nr:hypothetical protein F4805DRAFT_457040 [Annulohypoxylon moriforme]
MPHLRAIFNRQFNPLQRTVEPTMEKARLVNGIIPAWGMTWTEFFIIANHEMELGHALFFDYSLIGMEFAWPKLRTTADLATIPDQVGTLQMTHEQTVRIPQKFLRLNNEKRKSLTGDDVEEWHTASRSLIRQWMPQSWKEYIAREISFYDPRQQPSKSRTWSEVKRLSKDQHSTISFLYFETIRCTELGFLPTKIDEMFDDHYVCYRNTHLSHIATNDKNVVYDEDGEEFPCTMLPKPSTTLNLVEDLEYWRANRRWPIRVNSATRKEEIEEKSKAMEALKIEMARKQSVNDGAVQSLQQDVQRKEQELREIAGRMDRLRAQKAQEANELQKSLKEQQEELDKAKHRLEEAQASKARTARLHRRQLSNTQESLTKIEADLEKLVNDRAEMERQLQDLNNEIKSLTGSIQRRQKVVVLGGVATVISFLAWKSFSMM